MYNKKTYHVRRSHSTEMKIILCWKITNTRCEKFEMPGGSKNESVQSEEVSVKVLNERIFLQ